MQKLIETLSTVSVGQALTGGVTVVALDGEQEAINCRYRILRFGDEVKHGTRHSQEHFEQILADIDAYEIYCKDHKDFKNNKTKVTTERILDVYRKCVETDDFL